MSIPPLIPVFASRQFRNVVPGATPVKVLPPAYAAMVESWLVHSHCCVRLRTVPSA